MIKQGGQKLQTLSVKAGQTYTFRVTNSAGFPHNFYIGTAEQLQAADKSNTKGIADFSSGTQEFQYTFSDPAAKLQFACIVPGHYPTMHGDFTIQP